MNAHALEGGFADAATDAAFAFRRIMEVMARPGEIAEVKGATPPAPLSVAAGVVVLTLCDPETPVWLAPGVDTQGVRDWITFHTGAPFAAPGRAQFALGAWEEFPLDAFPIGLPDYPDRSTTMIVEMPELAAEGATLEGPGIEESARLNLPDLAPFQRNARLFPQGLDFIFTSGARLAALPRTTRVS